MKKALKNRFLLKIALKFRVIGNLLFEYSNLLRIVAGLVIIIFSLQFMGVLNLNFLNKEKRIYTKSHSDNLFFPLVVGAAFAFGWTPCIGPVLGSILTLAATESTVVKGILLLSFYSLGLAIPFILSGILMQKFIVFSKNIKQKINLITKLGGSLLLITGILIITNQLQVIGFYLLNYLPFFQSIG